MLTAIKFGIKLLQRKGGYKEAQKVGQTRDAVGAWVLDLFGCVDVAILSNASFCVCLSCLCCARVGGE